MLNKLNRVASLMSKTPPKLNQNVMPSTLNVAKKYHSGKISRGVANGLVLLLVLIPVDPSMHTGNTYRISLGQVELKMNLSE